MRTLDIEEDPDAPFVSSEQKFYSVLDSLERRTPKSRVFVVLFG